MDDVAVTIHQPFADLILAGVKDVENRGFRPVSLGELPARLWVHAAKQVDRAGFHRALDGYLASVGPEGSIGVLTATGTARRGVLLGSVTVTGCHHADECLWHDIRTGPSWLRGDPGWCSRWAEPDVWHWTLADPDPLPEPLLLRGRQGLWRLPEGVPA